MKFYKRRYKSKVFICVLLWFLITGYSLADEPSGETIRVISDKEMPTILGLVASQIRDNYERITTWSGEIDIKLNMLHKGDAAKEVFIFTDGIGEAPDDILQRAEEKTAFVIDVDKNFVYVDNLREKPSKYLNYITGTDLGNRGSSPYWSTSILRPDFLFEAQPDSFDTKNNKIIHRKAVKKPSRQDSATGLYEGIDDPRKTFMPGGGYIWEHFDGLVKRINKFGRIEFDMFLLGILAIKQSERLTDGK